MSAVVDWRFWLVKASDLSQIAELTMHDKSLSLKLNDAGRATGWMHLLDPNTNYVVEHQTALMCYRNSVPVWSGPIWTTKEDSSEGTDKLQITAMGWFENLNHRILHTGAEFAAMLAASSFPYTGIGTESALQLVYANTAMGSIAQDLLARGNVDSPTNIGAGFTQSTNGVNLTLQQFQSVGQQILRLANLESGFDFDVDPLSRLFNIYNQYITSTYTGKGVDRGLGTLFTYPGNCVAASRDRDGTKTNNREEITGQLGAGRADDEQSRLQNGLLEENQSLADVVDTNILTAFANAEVAIKKNPWQVVTFSPRAVTRDDVIGSPGVPRPFQDYNIGDIVYTTIKRGPRMRIGINTPQAVRIFAMNVGINDDGVEKITGVQTVYSGSGT